MRGKGNLKIALVLGVGITPAHAGKRRCPRFRPGKIRDHPRTCGEKVVWSAPLYEQMGSPPTMRGKVCVGMVDAPLLGITPACAGKRGIVQRDLLAVGDHPRVCGEKVCLRCCDHPVIGSPPHVRGKGQDSPRCVVCAGITPAHAGKRPAPPAWLPLRRDHPRTCGEK